MTLDAARTRLAIGLISLVTIGSVTSLLVMAATGAYADDYQLSAQTARTGFGLDDSSEVKIRGIRVGSVERIDLLEDGTVELTLNIAREIRIPIDATATIEPLSVFGPKFVDIRPGPNELDGPYHEPGGSMGAVVEPTELAETIDGVATLLENVDPDDVGTIVAELGRGLDGLGDEIGATIDAGRDIGARLASKRPVIERLLIDARAVAETLSSRSESISAIATDGQELLRSIDEQGDALGDLLVAVSELAVRGEDLLSAIGDDLDPTLIGLERGAGVLREQLRFLPDFVDGLIGVSELLGTGLVRWDRGDGNWGGLGRGIFDFLPCGFVADDVLCPPRPGYGG